MPKTKTEDDDDEIKLRPRKPFPCPSCGAATLIGVNREGEPINLNREGAAGWACPAEGCGFSVDGTDRCPSDGAPTRFDPTKQGTTVGGLRLQGWAVCDHCDGWWLSRRASAPTAGGDDGRWRICHGGRSVEAAGMRLRVDGKTARNEGAEIVQLMARISRVPAFESALEQIARGELDADAMRTLATEALSIGNGVDEIDGKR